MTNDENEIFDLQFAIWADSYVIGTVELQKIFKNSSDFFKMQGGGVETPKYWVECKCIISILFLHILPWNST